jgi:hypothetical protein
VTCNESTRTAHAFEQVGDRDLGFYFLTLHTTPAGSMCVRRGEWWLWGGKLTRMNEHRVSPYYRKRESTKQFCIDYTKRKPGCLTAEKAQAFVDAQEAAA